MTVKILVGDVRDRLAELPDNSIHCCVTSPPYWGLRDYKTGEWIGGDPLCGHKPPIDGRHDGKHTRVGRAATPHRAEIAQECAACGAVLIDRQLGREPTYMEHICTMVEVFRDVRRVLRGDGTLWLNYGDCYPTRSVGALKPKDAALIPHRLAIALQEDGWWVRSDIVWSKPNPMPSSVHDRPTTAKEYLFLLTKSARYFYDIDAIREELSSPGASYKMPDGWDTGPGGHGSFHRSGREKGKAAARYDFRREGVKHSDVPGQKPQFRPDRPSTSLNPAGRNRRDVWCIATEPFKEAHFATMPTKLAEPCILAGTSARGVCSCCSAPWERIIASTFIPQPDVSEEGRTRDHEAMAEESRWGGSERGATSRETLGWRPTCACTTDQPPVPATVLDIFGGSGTTGLVADRLGRDAILIELSPIYASMARERIASPQEGLLFPPNVELAPRNDQQSDLLEPTQASAPSAAAE